MFRAATDKVAVDLDHAAQLQQVGKTEQQNLNPSSRLRSTRRPPKDANCKYRPPSAAPESPNTAKSSHCKTHRRAQSARRSHTRHARDAVSFLCVRTRDIAVVAL